MNKGLLALTFFAATLSPAIAHDHDWPLDTDTRIEQALEAAYESGMTVVREIEFDDGIWEIEGRDATGARLELRIDGATGEIILPR